MLSRKNYSKTLAQDIPVDGEYFECNFMRYQPIDVGGLMRGVRLFPGDDTPRIFRRCNLLNCEVPPGSIIDDCNTAIVELNIETTTDSVTVDGVQHVKQHHANFIHGRFDPDTGTYIDLPTPIEIEVD